MTFDDEMDADGLPDRDPSMTALTTFLFPAPAERRTGAIIRWWEARRLKYNLIVGTAGVFTLGVANLVIWVFGDSGGPPWQGVVAFGIAANVCYTLGPMVEIAIHKLFGRGVLPTGPSLFRMGLTFSVGLALLPALILVLLSIARLVAIVIGVA